MPKRNKDGYVFFENQNYLRKVGTNQFFIYTAALASRDDMIQYNPFASDTTREIKKDPGVDDAEHRSNLTKEFIGLSREEIREAVKEMNRAQRMLWAVDLLFQQLPIHDLSRFSPSRIEVMKIIGPPVSGSDLVHTLEKYKTNPTNIQALLKEAAIENPTEPPSSLIQENESDDPITTTDSGVE